MKTPHLSKKPKSKATKLRYVKTSGFSSVFRECIAEDRNLQGAFQKMKCSQMWAFHFHFPNALYHFFLVIPTKHHRKTRDSHFLGSCCQQNTYLHLCLPHKWFALKTCHGEICHDDDDDYGSRDHKFPMLLVLCLQEYLYTWKKHKLMNIKILESQVGLINQHDFASWVLVLKCAMRLKNFLLFEAYGLRLVLKTLNQTSSSM